MPRGRKKTVKEAAPAPKAAAGSRVSMNRAVAFVGKMKQARLRAFLLALPEETIALMQGLIGSLADEKRKAVIADKEAKMKAIQAEIEALKKSR